MNEEELRQLRKSIKQETQYLIEKHDQKMRETIQYFERRLDSQTQMLHGFQKALNIITDKLIDHVVRQKE